MHSITTYPLSRSPHSTLHLLTFIFIILCFSISKVAPANQPSSMYALYELSCHCTSMNFDYKNTHWLSHMFSHQKISIQLWLFYYIGPVCLAHVVASSCLLPSYPLFILCMRIFSKHLHWLGWCHSIVHIKVNTCNLCLSLPRSCIIIHINCSTLVLQKSLTNLWIIPEKLFVDN